MEMKKLERRLLKDSDSSLSETEEELYERKKIANALKQKQQYRYGSMGLLASANEAESELRKRPGTSGTSGKTELVVVADVHASGSGTQQKLDKPREEGQFVNKVFSDRSDGFYV